MFFFFFNVPAPTEIYTLSLHDALPILRAERRRSDRVPVPARHRHWRRARRAARRAPDRYLRDAPRGRRRRDPCRSEEHTSELQSLTNLVCRLLLEKKKKKKNQKPV